MTEFNRQWAPRVTEPDKFHKEDYESATVPDLNMSVGELLKRHSRGGGLPVRDPKYFGVELPRLKDLTEVQEWKISMRERMKEIEQLAKQEIDEKNREREEAERKREEAVKRALPENEAGEETE